MKAGKVNSARFLLGYRRLYEAIVEYAMGPGREELLSTFARYDAPERALREYVRRLMCGLLFKQFLQKKGWMGASAVEACGVGDLVSDARVGSGIKVPYLHGGLFEQDEMEGVRFPLPARYMERILQFFAEYNFTIDENDPDDAEVGVDPEMLGRVFENLLEDNKDKGAFYTPKEIVQRMCRESLVAYLQTGVTDEATLAALRRFVPTHDAGLLGGADSALSLQVDERLRNVKICDPAIGSGAFPMGLLRELFACRQALEGIGPETAVQIKRHIIEQNIYGVDIERGAVDIARMRFYLSLMVDAATPEAVPPLDFKIVQGDALSERLWGASAGFDIVIGNPPYAVADSRKYQMYETRKCAELYAYFYELGIGLLRQGGILCYITASLWLKGVKFSPLRALLRREAELRSLRVEGDGVFAKVGMPTLTIMLSKGKETDWDFLGATSNAIVQKMSRHSTLASLSTIRRGLEIGRKQMSTRGEVAIITGGDVARYVCRGNHFISLETAAEYAKDERIFSGARLLLRETGGRMTCVYVDGHVLSNRSLYTILINDAQYRCKYVLGVLNSRVIQYYYSVKFKAETELFPKIRIAQVREMPIPLASPERQLEVERLVDCIMEAKRQDSEADTRLLEAAVDGVVCGLYGIRKKR